MKPIAIDLGLSVRWADRNFEAEDIYMSGTLFKPSGRTRSKAEEVALLNEMIRHKWGGKWRLPTVAEVQELQKSCRIWPALYRHWTDPVNKKGQVLYSMYKVKGKNGKYCYFNFGYHLLEGVNPESTLSDDGYSLTGIWEMKSWWIYYPYYFQPKSCPSQFQDWANYEQDYIPYGYYYHSGLPIRPVTDEVPSGRDKFLRFFEYNTLDGGNDNVEVQEEEEICFLNYDQHCHFFEEIPDEEKNRRYEARCEARERQKEREEREEREREERHREEQRNERQTNEGRSSYDASDDQYEERYRERERERRMEEEQRKRERLEDWYRDYVTIDVDFEYHYIDSEYNSDYWEPRNHEIRVTRREAMALIEAGESAIISRIGYYRPSLIRNVRYQIPYGLYDQP